jgi:phosphopantetheinyl transferase
VIDVWLEPRPVRADPRAWDALSRSERDRAKQIRAPERRTRYVADHYWVHQRLGALLGLAPADVPLGVDASGAPTVAGTGLHLSLSHHGEWIAMAVSDDAPVGIDVLAIPDDVGYLADTGLVLSPDEIEFVRSSPAARRGSAFAHCWVRKEAYAKAAGVGLLATEDLAAFSLTPDAARPDVSIWSRTLGGVALGIASATPTPPTQRLRFAQRSGALSNERGAPAGTASTNSMRPLTGSRYERMCTAGPRSDRVSTSTGQPSVQ